MGLAALIALLGGAVLAACGGGESEGYPPFEMTYTVSDSAETTWRLDYRSAEDWTKTVIAGDGGLPVGRSAKWNGSRMAWAESPDGPFVEDQSPQLTGGPRWPEYWFGPQSAMASDGFEEVVAPPGQRRLQADVPLELNGVEQATRILQVLTLDAETGIPIEYEQTGWDLLEVRFRAIELEVR